MKNTKILILLTLTFMACNVKDALDLKDKIKGKKRKIEEVDSSEEKKKLPVGEEDFKNIIEGDYYYVDKTLFIPEMLKRGAKVTAVMRPKRFGKTMMLSTCKYFFDIEGREENKKLFKGLNIEKSKYFQEQGKYPVIHLTFKDVQEESWEKCLTKIGALISDEYQNHEDKIEEAFGEGRLRKKDKRYFDNVIDENCSETKLEDSLKRLSRYLYKCYSREVVILIDEYDTPIIEGELCGYYEKVKRFMRNLLSAGLKDNVYLYRGLMTGIVRMSGAGIFSGLNNVDINTVADGEFGDKFGFTKDEVKNMLDIYGMEDRLKEVKGWYNGYKILKKKVYNPYSLLKFVKKKKIVNGWIESGDNELAIKKIRSFLEFEGCSSYARNSMEKIVSGGKVEIEYNQNIRIEGSGIDDALSLLLSTGFLTFEYLEGVVGRKDKRLRVFIPNNEVREVYKETLDLKVITKYKSREFEEFLEVFETGGEKEIREGIESHLMDASFHDFSEDKVKRGERKELIEKDYHNFLHGMFRGYIGRYEVKSNREAGKGRYDLMMIPKIKNRRREGMIVELKAENRKEKESRRMRQEKESEEVRIKSDVEAAKAKSKEGLNQIKDRGYIEELKGKDIYNVRQVGIGFVGKSVGVTIEDVEISS